MLLRYDPKDDPFEHLNDPQVLDNTPIGTLRVVPWANAASVAVMDRQDATRVQRIVHTLQHGENPLAAVYGKRTYEQTAVQAAYDLRDEDRHAAELRDEDALSKDNQDRYRHFLRRHIDGEEAALRFLRVREAG